MIKNTIAKKLGISEEVSKSLKTVWANMKARCTDKNHPSYKDYGARGIILHKNWNKKSFNFIKWAINNGYIPGLELDRINNNKGYYPENLRWTDRTTQVRNTRKLIISNNTGFRGVTENSDGKYRATISIKHKSIHLGVYKTKIEAAKAYDSYIIKNNTEHTKNMVLEKDEVIDYTKHMLLNVTNTSGYRGVSYRKNKKNPWTSRVYFQGKYKSLGAFSTAKDAAIARDKFIKENKLTYKLNF